MKKLTIFVPTYKRAYGLDRLLMSIFSDNDKYAAEVEVIISSNSPQDEDSRTVVGKWQSCHENIHFFCNEFNIGIDRNHDLAYQYCNTPYVLFLADDDYLMKNSLGRIINNCTNDCFFAIPTPRIIYRFCGKASACT